MVDVHESVDEPGALYELGEALMVQVGAAQVESGGMVAEHVPLHWIVPEFVCPQALAAEVQALPYPAGLAGVVAEQ